MIDLLLQFPLFSALLALVGMAAAFGALLGFAAVHFKTEGNPIESIMVYSPLGVTSTYSLKDASGVVKIRIPTR